MKPTGSATTGTLLPAPKAANPTGSQPGETGSVATSNGAVPVEMHPTVMGRSPSLNTDAVQSRLRLLGVNMSVKTELKFPGSSNGVTAWREQVVGMETTLSPSADIAKASAVIEESLLPAPIHKIEHWLAEVAAITARRTETSFEAEIALSAYTSRLAGYPGDIVRDTLLGWGGKWFPTWSELKEIMDERTAPRMALKNALIDASRDKSNYRLPAAFDGMAPEIKVQWLRKEADWARRTDAERAQELTEQADALEDKIRNDMLEG